MKILTPKEIAEKYVRGNHDALTDNQEIIDMTNDIENYVNHLLKNSDDINIESFGTDETTYCTGKHLYDTLNYYTKLDE